MAKSVEHTVRSEQLTLPGVPSVRKGREPRRVRVAKAPLGDENEKYADGDIRWDGVPLVYGGMSESKVRGWKKKS